ncbi:MAG: hypothetical protein J6B39_03895 [Lachnospiraceae bacterium]|nr:hypothetical protein [Lachnospiraceae bacterium]
MSKYGFVGENMIIFKYADKSNIEELLPKLYDILHTNMSHITPTGNTYETDRRLWLENVAPAMKKEQRQIILMYVDEELAGFFQYYVNNELFMMEEIQIKARYHGTGLFRQFFAWLMNELSTDLKYVEAYSDEKNIKSQRILEYLGLNKIGANKQDTLLHYRGYYRLFLEKFT